MYKVNVPTFNLDKLENVKSAVEHVGLYVGLVIFTAAGAKVNLYQNISLQLSTYYLGKGHTISE